MAGRIQLRRGTAAQWAATNPVLASGEKGVEIDTGREKNGDGTRTWNVLPYVDAAAAEGLAAHLAATTDAHDASAISLTPIAALGNPANVQDALAAVPGRFTPQVQTQPGPGVGVEVFKVIPNDSTGSPLVLLMEDVANSDTTRNRAAWFGYNTSADRFHGNAETSDNGKPTVIIGIEDNYVDGVNGAGAEFYVEFDNLQRPFYARSTTVPATTTIAVASNGQALPQGTINVASTTNFPGYGWLIIGSTTVAYTGKTATTFTGCTGGTGTLTTGQTVTSQHRENSNIQLDIGSDGTGVLSVFAGKANSVLFQIATNAITLRNAVSVQGNLTMQPATGQPIFTMTRTTGGGPAIVLQHGSTNTVTMLAISVDRFEYYDKNGRNYLAYVFGSTIAASLTDLSTSLRVRGNIGFYDTAPIAKPAVTGSRGGNAALASLLTQLAALGLVTDSTSA
jgi:hypothetical protein